MTPFPREPYRPLVAYIPDLRPAPVDLSDNTNLWGPHPAALRILQEAEGDDLARYPSGYGEPLKEAIQERFGVPLDSIATDCGSDDLLDSAFRAACDSGETVAYPVPTFSMIPILTRMNGLNPVEVRPPAPEERNGGSLLPSPELILATKPSAIYVCSPNNPTGEVATQEWLRDLLDAARSPDGPVIIVDEAYGEFHVESLLEEAPAIPRLVVTRTLSKAYGLAGLRIGFSVGDPEVIREIEKSRGPYKVGRLSERAASAALTDRSGWLEGIVKEVVENRERLACALRDRGIRPLPAGGNFLLVPVRGGAGGGTSSREEPPLPPAAVRVASRLREEGVAVRPLPDLPGIGDGLRVTVGPWSHMERFLTALDSLEEEIRGD